MPRILFSEFIEIKTKFCVDNKKIFILVNCGAEKLDLYLMVEAATFVSAEDISYVKEFLTGLVDKFDISESNTRVSVSR